jgi:histidinol-phosphate aminotransferase
MAGLRLGYAVATEANAQILHRQAGWNNVNSAGLAAALAGLSDPDLVATQRKMFTDTRRWLCTSLDREKRRYIASHTNFLMIHVGSDVAPIIRAFRERKILVGRKFPSMPDWLRVSIGRRNEMEAFLAALREVAPARAAA